MDKYVKYIRKSQFDRDYAELSLEETLKRHEQILDQIAESRGYYIATTYKEVASAESIAGRPEMQKLLQDVSLGLYRGVLVVDLERLARGNGADQAYICQLFQFTGTKIITPTKTYDPLNEADEDFFEFGLFMSRREYKLINRRLIRGREISASEGKWVHSIPPFGYRRVKLPGEKGYTLEIVQAEAEIVQLIFELYSSLQGTRNIANYLNDHQILSKSGHPWSASSVNNIITNVAYTGKIRHRWSKQIKTISDGKVVKKIKREKNPEAYSIYPGLHPAIISDELFAYCQTIRKTKQPIPRVSKEYSLKNPFAGLMICGNCGKPMARISLSNRQGGLIRLRCMHMRYCHNKSTYFEPAVAGIYLSLRQWFSSYEIQVDASQHQRDIDALELCLKQYAQRIEVLNAQLKKVYQMFEQDIYSQSEFAMRRDCITKEIHLLSEETDRTSRKLARMHKSKEKPPRRYNNLMDVFADIAVEDQNKLLKLLIHHIEYKNSAPVGVQITIFPYVPGRVDTNTLADTHTDSNPQHIQISFCEDYLEQNYYERLEKVKATISSLKFLQKE